MCVYTCVFKPCEHCVETEHDGTGTVKSYILARYAN